MLPLPPPLPFFSFPLLTAQPLPRQDRVRVYRELQLGGTLKPVGTSFQIDLERGSHKTSSSFGPSRTTVTESVAVRIHALISLDGLQPGEYLFHGADRNAPLTPSSWTRVVKATFKAHSGVALSPKDCRSSFITFMRDGDHGDEVLTSAATAMHHSYVSPGRKH